MKTEEKKIKMKLDEAGRREFNKKKYSTFAWELPQQDWNQLDPGALPNNYQYNSYCAANVVVEDWHFVFSIADEILLDQFGKLLNYEWAAIHRTMHIWDIEKMLSPKLESALEDILAGKTSLKPWQWPVILDNIRAWRKYNAERCETDGADWLDKIKACDDEWEKFLISGWQYEVPVGIRIYCILPKKIQAIKKKHADGWGPDWTPNLGKCYNNYELTVDIIHPNMWEEDCSVGRSYRIVGEPDNLKHIAHKWGRELKLMNLGI